MAERKSATEQAQAQRSDNSPDTIDSGEMLNALMAFKKGDFTYRMPYHYTGVSGKVADTFNEMMDMKERLTAEIQTVARVVGKEGNLSRRFNLHNMTGSWQSIIESLNGLVVDLIQPTSEMVRVINAVAKGDLSQKVEPEIEGRPLTGEFQRTASNINMMVDQLSMFSSEVTRVALEVGTEGKLGGQAAVKGVSGTWKDLTESVNNMASNLTDQVRNIAAVTTAVANGDLSKQITVNAKGEILELKNTINTMVDQLSTFSSEVTRVAREVGTEGKLGGQADVKGVSGTWRDLTESVNYMASNLTNQVRNIAVVTTAVANGDLSKKITADVQGEILELKNTINTMVDQLSTFASEVTRMAREVGTEGILGGQADVRGVSGTWKDLTDTVNFMASNLTSQVRNIAGVTTAVANGDLSKKITVDVKGELLELKNTINTMVDQLNSFASEVTRVAREVGTDGKLGGQAQVRGVGGIWKDLTDNVNYMASTLTTQVRAITNVATAVTKGDLSRSIDVAAAGEVAMLTDNINEMIRNLKETTRINTDQDWLKTNLAKFSRILQGQRDLYAVSRMILSELAPLVQMQHGVFYINEAIGGEPVLKLFASYAYQNRKNLANEFRAGEGLVGQCLIEKQRILLSNVPGDYVVISSGLGESSPLNIVLLPIIFEDQVLAILELASFRKFSEIDLAFLDQLTESIGIVINTMQANRRTEELLVQSQSLTEELQKQQMELQNTNDELEEKAKLLVIQKAEVESKNNEVEVAKRYLEEKAEQLALTSRYKSEFLANMSHELRTPLNSLLLLAEQLADNPDRNLNADQVSYARTIQDSGLELLNLINDILDLTKIESGTVSPDYSELALHDLANGLDRTFRHMVDEKKLEYRIQLDPNIPEKIVTDPKRLTQILKNLLSNAFKFTEKGQVFVLIRPATEGWSTDNESLNGAKSVLCFSVSDTGIGIAKEKQQIIFEAFQQADGSTNREYGGTGLGLAISKEIAEMLGGEITLYSELNSGSVFNLYLPIDAVLPEPEPKLVRLPEVIDVTPPTRARKQWKSPGNEGGIEDDRGSIGPDDRVFLVVAGDDNFGGVLLGLLRKKGFKAVVTPRGLQALELARQYNPVGIWLDFHLSDTDGAIVIEHLKRDVGVRHIPLCALTADEDRIPLLQKGVYDVLAKPVTNEQIDEAIDKIVRYADRPARQALLVGHDGRWRSEIADLLAGDDLSLVGTDTGRKALNQVAAKTFDCIVIGNDLPDMSPARLIREIGKKASNPLVPIIVHRVRKADPEQLAELEEVMISAVVKETNTNAQLTDETTLFLHQRSDGLREETRDMLLKLHHSDDMIAYRKVLIVDDDVRNIFALTSILERHQMHVLSAINGQDAITILGTTPDIDIVLMDIMMPVMDGYETTRSIRANAAFKELPIIALTAKAMKGDRELCLEAGASDYITKPVNSAQLLSMMREWLDR